MKFTNWFISPLWKITSVSAKHILPILKTLARIFFLTFVWIPILSHSKGLCLWENWLYLINSWKPSTYNRLLLFLNFDKTLLLSSLLATFRKFSSWFDSLMNRIIITNYNICVSCSLVVFNNCMPSTNLWYLTLVSV